VIGKVKSKLVSFSKEPKLKGKKAQYSWPPCTD